MQQLQNDHVADRDVAVGDCGREPFVDQRMVLPRPETGVSELPGICR
jgi:hypothetical protein